MAENFQNFYVTKLREACDASATTIYVDNPPNFSEGTLVIEFSNSTKHEIIHFTGKSGYGLTGCTRGHEGTTAQSHSAGVDVRQNVTAGILDKIINRAITTENIADNAVTTAKINNGAVTADKIDFTTMTDQPNVMPVADIILEAPRSEYRISLHRCGNLVFAYMDTNVGHRDNTNNTELSQTLPEGWRPAYTAILSVNSAFADKGSMRYSFSPDGSIFFRSTSISGDNSNAMNGSSVWITNDPWPTS